MRFDIILFWPIIKIDFSWVLCMHHDSKPVNSFQNVFDFLFLQCPRGITVYESWDHMKYISSMRKLEIQHYSLIHRLQNKCVRKHENSVIHIHLSRNLQWSSPHCQWEVRIVRQFFFSVQETSIFDFKYSAIME